MKHELKHVTNGNGIISGIIVNAVSDQYIGSYDLYEKDGCFFGAINIISEYQKMNIGFDVFKTCHNELSKSTSIMSFKSAWNVDDEYNHLENSQSSNLRVFLNLIESGMSEKIAIWQTPTGKWLKKLGFNSGQIIRQDCSSVQVIYYK